jgi:4-hydroxy-2-oxoheptanedioate aldolase
MREARLRTVWAEGGCGLNAWLMSPAPVQAELLAALDWDAITLDMQHGMFDYADAISVLQAISSSSATPMVRVPANEPSVIGKLLDAGVYGVICPLVNTAEEAAALVAACRYPPQGIRSLGPLRAVAYGGDDYVREANRTVIAIAQVETVEAVDNLEGILATPGLDAIYVGSGDLAFSMGREPAIDFTDPETIDVHREIVAAARRHGVGVGLYATAAADVRFCLECEADFVTLATDHSLLVGAAADLKDEAREAVAAAGRTAAVSELAAPRTAVGAYGGGARGTGSAREGGTR